MALVMLPCDLPWWSTVHKRLNSVQESTDLESMIEHMQKIHDLCNVSLDPDDDDRTENVFAGLRHYVQQMTEADRKHFVSVTMLSISRRAQSLKTHRPPRGLEFSLQQQSDSVEISYSLIAALLANAFFSTFPKRTPKTHPTLQDFNFTNFFKHLDQPIQQAKFQSIITYFDWIELEENVNGSMTISRQVMSGKQWLTIEDWFECEIPLCPLDIRHSGKLERSKPDYLQTVFVSPKLGSRVLYDGESQECLHFSIFPEMLPILLHVEALEDNETILIENARQIGQIVDTNNKPKLEPIMEHRKISLLLMDAEDYTDYPINQLEEDNILRELNKCLLAFSQKSTSAVLEHLANQQRIKENAVAHRVLLSPIGENPVILTPSPPESPEPPHGVSTTIVVRQASSSTKRSSYDSEKIHNDIAGRRAWLTPDRSLYDNESTTGPLVTANGGCGMMTGRRGRFIVLGSSGECLPVNRHVLNKSLLESSGSMYSSCEEEDEDDDDEYLSARESIEREVLPSDKSELARHYAMELERIENRLSFTSKLRQALSHSDGSDGNYTSGDTTGSTSNGNPNPTVRRALSTGFVLQEDSLDDEFYNELNSSSEERLKVDKYKSKLNGSALKYSSSYSFSSDYSSELEEIYEEFSRWIDTGGALAEKHIENRDEAIAQFASSLLKRTLSESFVGVKMADGGAIQGSDAEREHVLEDLANRKIRLILSSRSLSLELEKQKYRIAHLKNTPPSVAPSQTSNTDASSINSRPAKRRSLRWSIAPVNSQQTVNCDDVTLKLQLTQQKATDRHLDVRPVATGNWGCGRALNGDVQLKLIIQWLAASLAGLPCLMYYTSAHPNLSKLDTISRVLRDRKWTVGALASATLKIAQTVHESNARNPAHRTDCFFEKFIGIA